MWNSAVAVFYSTQYRAYMGEPRSLLFTLGGGVGAYWLLYETEGTEGTKAF